jgi:hypothetical protein
MTCPSRMPRWAPTPPAPTRQSPQRTSHKKRTATGSTPTPWGHRHTARQAISLQRRRGPAGDTPVLLDLCEDGYDGAVGARVLVASPNRRLYRCVHRARAPAGGPLAPSAGSGPPAPSPPCGRPSSSSSPPGTAASTGGLSRTLRATSCSSFVLIRDGLTATTQAVEARSNGPRAGVLP